MKRWWRLAILLVGLAVLGGGVSVAQAAETVENDWLCLPFERVGPILASAKEEIDSYLKKMDEMAVGWDADERKNTRKLAEFYAKMDPQNAAKLLSEIEPERVARILANLSDRQAGAIMDSAVSLGPDGIKLAVQWTDIIRQLKEPKKPTP